MNTTSPIQHRPPHRPQLDDAIDHVRRAAAAIGAVPRQELTHAEVDALLDAQHALDLARFALENAARRMARG